MKISKERKQKMKERKAEEKRKSKRQKIAEGGGEETSDS